MREYVSGGELCVYLCRYQPSIYNLSGVPDLVAKYGDWFSWSGSPRAKIFSRNISDVVDLPSMIALMRYVCVCACV